MAAKRVFRKRARKGANDAQAKAGMSKSKVAMWVKGILLFLALLLTLLPVLFLADPVTYVPFIMLVLMVLVSFVYVRVLKATLSFDESGLADQCERGEKIDFTVGLHNASFLPHPRLEIYFYITDLFGDYDAVTPLTTTLAPFEKCDFSFSARFTHLGEYGAGISKIVVHDLLGLFTATITNDSRHLVSVLPRVFDIQNVDLTNVTTQESKNQFRPIITDDMDYAGVREYQLGDPMKTVHWNLSSRNPSGELYTRLFEVFANPGLSIVIDPYAPPYGSEELMCVFDGLVESAVSANAYAREMGVDCDVTYISKHGEATTTHIAGRTSTGGMVQNMLRVTRADDRDVDATISVELLKRMGYSTHGQGNLAYCTSRLDDEAISTLIEVKMRRRNPLLFLSVPRALQDKEREEFLAPLRRVAAAGIIYYLVESNEFGTEVGN